MVIEQHAANNHRVTEEIKREIKNYLETSENGDTTYQHFWDAAKAVLRGKLIEIIAYIKKQKNLKQTT